MLRVTEIAENKIIVAEHYAVEIIKTGRGFIAEVKDSGSPFHGVYALGSDQGCALAALALKISRME